MPLEGPAKPGVIKKKEMTKVFLVISKSVWEALSLSGLA